MRTVSLQVINSGSCYPSPLFLKSFFFFFGVLVFFVSIGWGFSFPYTDFFDFVVEGWKKSSIVVVGKELADAGRNAR